MENVDLNEYNINLQAVLGSWELFEFCEKEADIDFNEKQTAYFRQALCRKLLPKFYREHADVVQKLQQRAENCYTNCGFIAELSHDDKVYDFMLYTNVGLTMPFRIPNEFFSSKRYKPKEGDRITYSEDKEGNIAFCVRKNQKDQKIYSMNKYSEYYKSAMDSANKRKSVPEDKLAVKQRRLTRISDGLHSQNEKDRARLDAYRASAIFDGSFKRLHNR